MRWELYCRVIDNHGDLGVAWRLASDLAARGESVRLAVDDRSALAWMAPSAAAGQVELAAWDARQDDARGVRPDVVVELFGGGLPAATKDLAAGHPSTIFINLEHLSAERYVERCHGLPSPRSTPDGVQTTWFYYPGFTPATGGLLREAALVLPGRRSAGERHRDLQALGLDPRPDERVVSLFCYRNPGLDELLESLAEAPTLLLLTPGPATEQATAALGPSGRRGLLRAVPLGYLEQAAFDRLLAACDLNFVRGEDSLVRAIWAGAPFVWQLYPQSNRAHADKLEAFLTQFLDNADPALAAAVGALFRRWNGSTGNESDRPDWPDQAPWRSACERWRRRLAAQRDLGSQLVDFAMSRQMGAG